MTMRRKPTAKPLSELLPQVLKPVMEQHGLATSQIITRWRDIAGEDLSRVTRPLRINWPRLKTETGEPVKNPSGATLVLLVESAFALDVQHEAPLILERINTLYGWAAVQKINIRQGPVREEIIKENQYLNENDVPPVQGIEDDGLRAALQKLGRVATKRED